MKIRIMAVLMLMLLILGGCKKGAESEQNALPEADSGAQEHSEHIQPQDGQEQQVSEQEKEHKVLFTCGNTITKLYVGDGINEEQKTYEFEGGHSVKLSQLLADLEYSPDKLCKCLPKYRVDTEYKLGYGIDLGEAPYARCDEGQAELTKEQAETVRKIIDDIIAGKNLF